MTKKEKLKPVHKLIELYVKEFKSYLKNSNTQKPIKYYLRDYINTLTNHNKYQIIHNLCAYIFNENYLTDEKLDAILEEFT